MQQQTRPLVEECSVDNWAAPLACDAGVSSTSGGVVVALGKFDAMHLGHMALAVKAAQMGGHPMLLSFSGMAEVLGWPARLPLVAPVDRARVLQLWGRHCQGRVPRQRTIPFSRIRTMPPEAFVQLLAQELRASGVVAGCNYRFGFKAQGDAQALRTLGTQHGLQVAIMELVEDEGQQGQGQGQQGQQGQGQQQGQQGPQGQQHGGGKSSGAAAAAQRPAGDEAAAPQVSSSKVRSMLASGDMPSVRRILGRPYRLVVRLGAAHDLLGRQQPGLDAAPDGSNGSQGGSSQGGVCTTGPAVVLWQEPGQQQQGQQPLAPAAYAELLNQPPGPGTYQCSVALVVCTRAGGGAEGEAAGGWAEPHMPPALATLEGQQGAEGSCGSSNGGGGAARPAGGHAFSTVRVHVHGGGLQLEHAGGGTAGAEQLMGQALSAGAAPAYLAIDFDHVT